MAQTVDLRAQEVNIKVTRGDAWALSVTFPGDLTGYEVRGQVRLTEDATESSDLVVVVDDAPAGKFSYGQNSALDGRYDIELVPPSGLGRTWIKGAIETEKDVTRV